MCTKKVLFIFMIWTFIVKLEAMMFLKVTIFISICAVDSRILLTELETAKEIPAQRLNEQVGFPMVNTYHRRNVLRSMWRPVRSAHQNLFQELQYAPLYGGLRWKSKTEKVYDENTQDTSTYTPTSLFTETEYIPNEKRKHLYRKSHLEPRPNAMDNKCYATENNAEMVTSASRSPGHNVLYNVYPESMSPKQEKKVIDYLKPIGINLNFESLTSTPEPLAGDLSSKKVNRHLELSKEQFGVINPIEHFVMNPKAIKSKRYLPYTKYHRLHLNIARVYSPGQLPQKRPRLPVGYARNLGRRNKYSPANVAPAYKDLNQPQDNMLQPVKRNRKAYHFRASINL